jgi:hypothetical protein
MWKIGCLTLFVLLNGSASWAVPITLIHVADGGSFFGSLDPDGAGPIDPAKFEVDHFTITGQGDTSDRFGDGFSLFIIPHTSAQIEIPGVGTFAFLIPTFTAVVGAIDVVDFVVDPGFVVLEGPESPVLGTYDLLSSVGPIFGVALLKQWTVVDVVTSGGVLVFEDGVMQNGSFEAIVEASAPEPESLSVLALALLATQRALRRGRRSSRTPHNNSRSDDSDSFSRQIEGSPISPSWTIIFQRASAIVADGGSALCHAAIVAREHGIPAVVATGNGTKRLRDGQRVLVDGNRGTVSLVDD